MTKSDQKPFVVVGGHIYSKDNVKTYISPRKLMELYGLTEEECYLGDISAPVTYLAVGKVIRLFPREHGDYEEHLIVKLKKDWEQNGGEIVKRAKKKTRFKTEVDWYKKLQKKGKG